MCKGWKGKDIRIEKNDRVGRRVGERDTVRF